MNTKDIRAQAEWELSIERFEEEVAKEKIRLRSKRFLFPWRVKLINLNKTKEI